MKFRLLHLLTFSIFIISCAAKHEEDVLVPPTILDNQQLAEILTDAYLAEGATGINIKGISGQQFDSVYLFNPLKEHGCSKSKFDSSMVFYTQHPIVLKNIYDQVLEKLNKIAARDSI
jgi:hypothetical protein